VYVLRPFGVRFGPPIDNGFPPWNLPNDVGSCGVPIAAEEMPGKLAAAAFELFSQRGIGRVRMDDIATGAGVTKGSLYWHYQSKNEVIHAACRHYYDTWRSQMDRETAKTADPVARLERAIRSSVRTCLIDQANRTFTLELFTLSLHDTEIRKGWRSFFDSVKAFYIALLTDAMAGGGIATSDPETAVDLMLAAMEGYKLRALFEPELCNARAERRISGELLGLIGIHR
jgi:AcrR family transcriptional regulator